MMSAKSATGVERIGPRQGGWWSKACRGRAPAGCRKSFHAASQRPDSRRRHPLTVIYCQLLPVSDFSIYNLPFGVFDAGRGPRVGVAFGDAVVDLAQAASLGYFRNVRFPDLSVLLAAAA